MSVNSTLREEQASAATPGTRAVGIWLAVCAAMVLAMAVIGAITRLTESGLSIMEWAPVTGALPPLDQAEWERLFALYRTIPEYMAENAGMSLAEFKTIFWWEWIHRLWGRLIGLVFLLPLGWFWVTGRVRRPLTWRLLAVFALGGLQGALGWYMVASGFAERSDVSQYRLVAHLALAVLIYALLLRLAIGLLFDPPAASRAAPGDAPGDARVLRPALAVLIALTAVTILSGGFVAGLNAGLDYNTFPLMDGRLVPAGYGDLAPWYLNLFENVAAVQFNHRLLAVATVAAALGLWLWAARLELAGAARRAVSALGIMALIQLGLGIATLILVVPVWLGALHQAGALVLLGLGLWAWSRLTSAPLQPM